MELLEIGKAPISPDHPAGTDPSYEPEFEQLQTEIDKLSMPSADGQGIDWDKIIKVSTVILGQKGKHMQVAAYLAVALLRKQALPGLADGVRILADLTITYWEDLFPPKKRLRGRANALGWFRDQVQNFFDNFTSEATFPKDVVDRLVSGFSDLDSFAADNFPDGPSLHELLEVVKRLPVDAPPAPVQAPPPAQAPAAGAVQAASPAAAPVPTVKPAWVATDLGKAAGVATGPVLGADGKADPAATLQDLLNRMTAAAALLIQADSGDPRAYILARLGAWLKVDGPPPAESGVTMIPPPDDSIKSSLTQLLAGRQYEDAARQAESQIPVYLFWLDLSRISAQALESLGMKGRDALDVVKLQTSLYVNRIKGIENLCFSDGTPFADAETKTWLRSFPLCTGQAVDAAPADSALGKAMEQVNALGTSKKFLEAVTLLQDVLRQSNSGRERFDALIAMAGMLSQSGRADLAGPNVDELLDLVSQYKLEQWEPDTALRGLLAAYAVLTLDESDEGKAKTRQVLSRVARINPAAAMRVSG